MDYSKLGERIREERLKRRLTQEKLAEAVDISTTYIGQIERGEKSLTLDTFVGIANCLELSMDYLLRDSLIISEKDLSDDWAQLTAGRSNAEKKMMMEIVRAVVSCISKK